MSRWVAAILLVAVLGSTWIAAGRLEALVSESNADVALLYLPNGKLLKLASLGHATLLADGIYLWAIQYYSNYNRSDRYRYLEHIFDRVITELDPHYIDAYWLGALILIVETHDLDAGLRLLDKGADRNPDKWILPYLAGWECYHAGQYERAGTYFDRAALVPSAPPVVRRMGAGMRAKAGNVAEAVALWRELLQDADADAASKSVAERQLRELRGRVELGALQSAVARFRSDNGRLPRRLEELVAQGYIGSLPGAANGRAYDYDPQTGRVRSPEGRVLGGS